MRLERARQSLHEHVERGVGRLELITLGLQIDNLLQNRIHQGLVVRQLVLGGQGGDVRSAGELADQNPPLVADKLRVHVLVAAGGPGDGMHVHPTLVGKRALTDERLIVTMIQVGRLINKPRQLGQVCQRPAAEDLIGLLDSQIRHDGDQIGVAAPLADAVDRALHLYSPGIDGRQRIGDRQLAVVVRVDADGHFHRLQRLCRRPCALGDDFWQ